MRPYRKRLSDLPVSERLRRVASKVRWRATRNCRALSVLSNLAVDFSHGSVGRMIVKERRQFYTSDVPATAPKSQHASRRFN